MALHWQVIVALVLGIIYSVVAVKYQWLAFTSDYIAPFGDIFVRVLKLIAVPMVLFSIIAGIGSLKNIKQLGRVGVKTLLIYVGTTMSAICIGLLFVNMIQPGTFPSDESRLEKRIEYELWLGKNPSVPRLDSKHVVDMPQNAEIVAAVKKRLAVETVGEATQKRLNIARNEKTKGPLDKLVDVVPSNIMVALSTSNMLQIIFFEFNRFDF